MDFFLCNARFNWKASVYSLYIQAPFLVVTQNGMNHLLDKYFVAVGTQCVIRNNLNPCEKILEGAKYPKLQEKHK